MLVWLWNKHFFVYVNHARIRSWNQQELTNPYIRVCVRPVELTTATKPYCLCDRCPREYNYIHIFAVFCPQYTLQSSYFLVGQIPVFFVFSFNSSCFYNHITQIKVYILIYMKKCHVWCYYKYDTMVFSRYFSLLSKLKQSAREG